MKVMKKVAATLLGVTMAFSLGSCGLLGGGKEDSSKDWNNSGPNGPGSTTVTGEGAKYIEGIADAILEANTISMNVSFDVSFSEVDKTYGKEVTDEYTSDSYIDSWNDSVDGSANGNVTITAAKAGETYSLSMTGNVSYNSVYYDYDYEAGNYDEQVKITEQENIALDIRIIGDMGYMLNPEDNKWYKAPIDWEDLMYDMALADTPVNSVLGMIYTILAEGDLTEVANLLGPIFEQTLMLDIQNHKYEFEWDIAEDYNAVVGYLTDLDYTQTLTAFLNSILKEEDTSVEEILGEIAAKGTMTVQELYNELNKALVEETGKDINGLKDELIAKIDLNQFKDMMEQETFEEIQQSVAMIAEMKVEEMLADFMPLTLNDLVTMMYADEELSSPITLEMMKDEVLAMLNSMTLADALGEEYFEALNELKALNLDELEENLCIQFNGYKISNVSYDMDMDFDYENEETSMAVDSSVSVAINLSQETTSIVAPEGAIEMPNEDEM